MNEEKNDKKFNLEEEVICNFTVTVERKKVWEKELDILEKIIKICEENDIKYSLCGGSLLGAVRHKGFIPWDDDIDVCMKREDYLKFLGIAEKELSYPYFVQYSKTEKMYTRGHAQIRNSETTAILKIETTKEGKNNYNKGIFVDIFPLDNVPDDLNERNKFIEKIISKKKLINMNTFNDYKLRKLIKNIIISILSITGNQRRVFKLEKYIQKYNKFNTKQCGAIDFFPTEFKYDNKWFDSYIKLPFEYLNASCIKDYDELLTRQYGNYMKIPEDKNGTKHGKIIFDTEKSYKEYERGNYI